MAAIRIFLVTADTADQLDELLRLPLVGIEAGMQLKPDQNFYTEVKLDSNTADMARESLLRDHAALKIFKIESDEQAKI